MTENGTGSGLWLSSQYNYYFSLWLEQGFGLIPLPPPSPPRMSSLSKDSAADGQELEAKIQGSVKLVSSLSLVSPTFCISYHTS